MCIFCVHHCQVIAVDYLQSSIENFVPFEMDTVLTVKMFLFYFHKKKKSKRKLNVQERKKKKNRKEDTKK